MSASEPSDQITVEAEHNRVHLRVDRSLYPLDAVYGAAYVLIDRCFVLLDAPSKEVLQITLRGRSKLEAGDLENLAGELANELLTQAWRHQIITQNQPIIEAVAAQALAGAAGPAPLDDLGAMSFSKETFEDPLGIAMSWEEKYGKGEATPAREGSPMGLPPSKPGSGDGQ